jgi:hypothetical protein
MLGLPSKLIVPFSFQLDTDAGVVGGFRIHSASSTRVSVPATAAGCRLVTTRGSADVANGPRFVAKQGRGLDLAAPRWWRCARLLRPSVRNLS